MISLLDVQYGNSFEESKDDGNLEAKNLRLQAEARRKLPENLRVKPFVISMEDIKLDKSLFSGTTEIQLYKPETKRQKGDDRGERGTSFAYSASDVS